MRKISVGELQAAVERAGLPGETYDRIRVALDSAPQDRAGFEAAHVGYYLGALLIIGAMGWFVTSAWDTLSGLTIAAIALAYGIIFSAIGFLLFRKPSTKIPGALLTTVAVCMTPLFVYGIEKALHLWPQAYPGAYIDFHPYINANWVGMEIATILVALIALYFVRFPFITAPAAYALWYLSMDATALIFGKQWTFHQECHISIVFGLAMLLIAYILDGRTHLDFSFWFYLFGLITFSCGLTFLGDGRQLGRILYGLIHLSMLFIAVILQRRVFLVFGAIGVFIFLMGEVHDFFRNSFGFTIFLTLLGILFIWAGIAFKKHEQQFRAKLSPLIPARFRDRAA